MAWWYWNVFYRVVCVGRRARGSWRWAADWDGWVRKLWMCNGLGMFSDRPARIWPVNVFMMWRIFGLC